MGEELDNLTLAVEQVLGKVPGDFTIGRLRSQVLEDRAGVVPIDIDLAHDWESDLVVLFDPVLDRGLIIRLLRAKLVAREGQDLQAVCLVGVVHLLVLAIVPIGQASLRGYIDDDDGLGSLGEFSDRALFLPPLRRKGPRAHL